MSGSPARRLIGGNGDHGENTHHGWPGGDHGDADHRYVDQGVHDAAEADRGFVGLLAFDTGFNFLGATLPMRRHKPDGPQVSIDPARLVQAFARQRFGSLTPFGFRRGRSAHFSGATLRSDARAQLDLAAHRRSEYEHSETLLGRPV